MREWSREEGKSQHIVGRVGDAKNVSLRLTMTGRANTAAHRTPCYAQVARCATHTRCLFAAYSAGTVLQRFWKQRAATTLDSTISVTQPKLFSQKHNSLTFAVSLHKKRKGSVPYFSKMNATVKSWRKIRVTTTLPKKVTGMNSCRANFYFKDNHPTPVTGKTKY